MGTAFRFRIWFTLLWLAGIVAALIALSLSQAHAQSMACLEFQKLAKGLADKYHEVPAGSGITGQGSAALIVFASPAGATWTVAILDQKGQACVVATGQDWLDVIPPKEVVPGRKRHDQARCSKLRGPVFSRMDVVDGISRFRLQP